MRSENLSALQKTHTPNDLPVGINDLPEIAVLNCEIERFKKVMLQNPGEEEEDSYRAVAERHILNGLERARDLLILNYVKSGLVSTER